ncbi:hypothetical protein Tco_0581576 [Tanacetum coccineum]
MACLCDLSTLRRAVLSSSFKSGDYDGFFQRGIRVVLRSDFKQSFKGEKVFFGSKSASSIPDGIDSLVRQASISSKMKSPPSKGVREVGEVERIGSKVGVGLPLLEMFKNPSTS